MNRTVSKLLDRYAAHAETDSRKLKKWWKTLSWQEKTAERKRMEAEMGYETEDEATEEA